MSKMPAQKPHRSKQDYVTPACFIDPVKDYLGISEFYHDFAADTSNTQAGCFWDIHDNSLSKSSSEWAFACGDGWGWLNPPFTLISPWAQRCKETLEDGGRVALLVPAAIGSNWFRDYVYDTACVLALNGRIPFMPNKPTWGYPKDCILALYSPEYDPGFHVWKWR